jgi:hypothetical protein
METIAEFEARMQARWAAGVTRDWTRGGADPGEKFEVLGGVVLPYTGSPGYAVVYEDARRLDGERFIMTAVYRCNESGQYALSSRGQVCFKAEDILAAVGMLVKQHYLS